MDGEPLYGGFPSDNQHGDTYGPVDYYAYVPFEQALPVERPLGRPARGPRRGDRLRPADRRCCCSCSAGGSGGRTLGIALAYAWAAFPFTPRSR